MEQDHLRIGAIQPLLGPTGHFQERTEGTLMQGIWWLRDVPPSHSVFQQPGWARKVLLGKHAQETPVHLRASVYAVYGATQLLNCTATMLVLQPKCQAHHDSGKCSVHWGCPLLQSESPRKLAPRSIATTARNMGEHILPTTWETV